MAEKNAKLTESTEIYDGLLRQFAQNKEEGRLGWFNQFRWCIVETANDDPARRCVPTSCRGRTPKH